MTTFPSEYLFAEVSIELAAAKRARGRCVSRGCRRRAAKKKGGRCNTCSSRLFRLRDDTRYAFNNLKSSARKRGIPFHLDYETFGEFCAVTGYLEMRGKEPHSFSIDRIRTSEPYQIGNIRILTYADNVSHKYEDAAERCRALATKRVDNFRMAIERDDVS
jgi:hypothetical protein